MFDAHQTILRLGLEAARRTAGSAIERSCVDAAAAMNADGARAALIHASPVVTALPHREPERRAQWRRTIGDTTFAMESAPDASGPLGVPFGAKARIILLHLVDAA